MSYIDKVWITGANGRLGRELVKFMNPLDFEVLTNDIDEVDITNMDEVSIFADVNRPQVIINCASITNVIECEKNPEKAFLVNSLGARNIAIVANRINAKLIHMSTDDVFDGRSAIPYREMDEPNPKTIYGKSKYLGENFVKTFSNKFFIVRSSWIYSSTSTKIKNMVEAARKGQVVYVAKNQVSSPTSSKELARFIAKLMNTQEYGIYHACCEGIASRREFAEELFKYLGMSANVREVDQLGERIYYPDYSVLDNFLLKVGNIYKMPTWQEALKDYVKEVFVEKF